MRVWPRVGWSPPPLRSPRPPRRPCRPRGRCAGWRQVVQRDVLHAPPYRRSWYGVRSMSTPTRTVGCVCPAHRHAPLPGCADACRRCCWLEQACHNCSPHSAESAALGPLPRPLRWPVNRWLDQPRARCGRPDSVRSPDLRQFRRGVAGSEGGRRGGRPVRQGTRRRPQDCRVEPALEFTWRNSEQLQGDLVEAVTALKNEPGDGVIGLSGSVSVVRQLLAASLLDELHLLVHPIALRKGMRLFDEGETPIPLKLISSSEVEQRSGDGEAQVVYVREECEQHEARRAPCPSGTGSSPSASTAGRSPSRIRA